MNELELAIQYLEKRAISTKKSKSKFFKQFGDVLPLSEVKEVFEMLQKKEFAAFHKLMKEKGFEDFN